MSGPATSTLTVDLSAYAHNLEVVRGYVPEECRVVPVVKANAYGLGAVAIAQRAVQEGATELAVATVEEAIELGDAGIRAEILILVQPLVEAFGPAIDRGLKMTISDLHTAEKLGEVARRMKRVAAIHCKIDTGMGRQGFSVEEAAAALLQITRMSNVDIEGISTHFPGADVDKDAFTTNQIKTFKNLLRELERLGIPYEQIHAANSAAVVNFPSSAFDFVRPGLMTYGVWPASTAPTPSPLKPVVCWTSRIAAIRKLPGGVSVSYGRTYRTEGPVTVAIVPVGYADGFPFSMSNVGEVLIRGVSCPVRGRVCMDSIVVEVAQHNGAVQGDKVTLIGEDGGANISVEGFAQKAQTIPYEVLTGIGARVERVYTS